jgi:lipoprotein-anchoring transpeptidase ErfK/SrfK
MVALPGLSVRLRAAVALSLCLLLWGCGGGGGDGGESSEQGGDATKVFFTAGEQFKTVERDPAQVPAAPQPAIEALLRGPTAKERQGGVATETQIPPSTKLESVKVAGDGTAVVKLSPEFMRGIPAARADRDRDQQAELKARIAQVTYTATQFKRVKDAVVVSGGTVVAPDVDRQDYAAPERAPKPVVKPLGARVPGTRRVQKKLAKLGYLPKSAVDGLDGYQTRQAVIAFQAWNGLDRDGEVGPVTTAALSTARRPKPRPGGPPRRIEVYRDRGVALLIDGGRTVRAIHVSSGGPATPTPSGRYSVFRKELRSWSVPFQTWLPYASYFNAGIAFHEYPDVPPYPASHGCVRVGVPEARSVYAFATIGTAVVVF